MPFYDENTAAGGIQIDFRGSFNIFYIIKYIEEMFEEHEDALPFELDEIKNFNNIFVLQFFKCICLWI